MPGEDDLWLRQNALRLLRQQWQSPSALAQELYAILADTPSEAFSAEVPEVQARKPEVSPPEVRQVERDRRSVSTGFPTTRTSSAVPGPRVSENPAPQPEFPRARRGPLGWSSPDHKALKMDNPFPDWEWFLPLGGGGGTSTFIGQVLADTVGDTVRVRLFPNGKNGTPGEIVMVQILQIDLTETVPGGMWISGIQELTDDSFTPPKKVYLVQVPIWL